MQGPIGVGPIPQVSPDMLNRSGERLAGQIRSAQASSGEKRNAELKKASEEFESLFVAYLLKVMRETIEESGLMDGGFGKTLYTELFDQEISRSIAQHGALGIADLVYKNLSASTSVAGKEDNDQLPGIDPVSPSEAPSPATPQGKGAPGELKSDISDFQLPVRTHVSSGFGWRLDPFSHQPRLHKGVDISAPEGTDVLAAMGGRVAFAGYENGYGNTVLIQHSEGLQTRYAHLHSVNVKTGDAVSAQEVVGVVGDTGRSTGPHLHFEVIRMGEQIDPRGVLTE